MIKKLNIRVTSLDQFMKYATEAFNGWYTIDKLIEYLTEPYTPKKEVDAGTLIHALIEFGPDKYNNGDGTFTLFDVSIDSSLTLTKEVLQPILDYRSSLPTSYVHEASVAKWYTFGEWRVRLSGKIDGINGLRLKETKTKNKTPKRDDYFDSMQWRAYLEMLPDAQGVDYNVFQIKNKYRSDDIDKIILHKYTFDRSSSRPHYVEDMLNRFVKFIIDQNLVEYFQPSWLVSTEAVTDELPDFFN